MWNNIYKGLSMSDKSMTDRISLLFFIFYLCFYRPKDNLMYIKCLQHIYEYRFTISVNDNEFTRLRKIFLLLTVRHCRRILSLISAVWLKVVIN